MADASAPFLCLGCLKLFRGQFIHGTGSTPIRSTVGMTKLYRNLTGQEIISKPFGTLLPSAIGAIRGVVKLPPMSPGAN